MTQAGLENAAPAPPTSAPRLQPLEALYSAQEVADALGTSVRSLQRWVSEGRVPCHRPGGHLRFTADDYEAILAHFAVPTRPALRRAGRP